MMITDSNAGASRAKVFIEIMLGQNRFISANPLAFLDTMYRNSLFLRKSIPTNGDTDFTFYNKIAFGYDIDIC
jgi:hypothetical protein